MREKNVLALGYKRITHGGYSWLASEEGARFLLGIDDWSDQGLETRKGWISWKRYYHVLYLAEDQGGKRYLVKIYSPKKGHNGFFPRKVRTPRSEFYRTLTAYQRNIRTVLPSAVGEGGVNGGRAVIVFPFLENAVGLTHLYTDHDRRGVEPSERHFLERELGRLTRQFVDAGIYLRELKLDHFMFRRESGQLVLYCVDLERVQLRSFFKKRILIKTLATLLAQLERLRIAGARINRSSMMRVAHAHFHQRGLAKLDKALCLAVIQAAREFWYRRKFHLKGLRRGFSLEPDRQDSFVRSSR